LRIKEQETCLTLHEHDDDDDDDNIVYISIYVCSTFVGLDSKLYKMHVHQHTDHES